MEAKLRPPHPGSVVAILASLLVVTAGGPPSAAAPAPAVDFARDIRPILAARCFKCHGPEKRKGGLRLDEKAAALAGGDAGTPMRPGKSAESELFRRVAGVVPEDVMPPEGDRLPPAEIEILRRWIDAGAPWPDGVDGAGTARPKHWAFQAPARPTPPAVRSADWARNPIDAFVLARLERAGIRPAPEADRITLARRLSLDLTGLPPSPAEVDAFVADRRPDAYERLVDRLLASPHFGEQWARHWLDLARYADSDGYEKDFLRPHAWRWRRWVIDSINRDQPFDAFTRDQLAGDLLPGSPLEARVATGFLRQSLLNREGGVDVEEDRTKIVVDRVSTLGSAWLGLTVGCAECHSHKYDPITQREFYQLYAFFNSLDDRDVPAPLPETRDTVGGGEAALAAAKQVYAAAADAELETWATRVAALPDVWQTPRIEDYDLPTFGANNGANLYHQEDGSFLVTGMVEDKTHYIMMLSTRLDGVTAVRVEAMTDEMLPRLGPGHAPDGGFVLTEVKVESASLKDVSNLRGHKLVAAHADHGQPGHPVAAAIDGDEQRGGWAVGAPELPIAALDRAAVFVLDRPAGYGAAGMRLKVSLVQHEGKSRSLGRLRVSYTTADPRALAAQAVPQRIREIARLPRARRTVDQQVTLRRYHQATFRRQAPELAAISRVLADAPGVKGEVRAPVVAERRTPRPTHVHVRGNFLERGAAVAPGAIEALGPFRARGPRPDRLDLASWVTAPENPLVARVAANHFWRQLFGEGLVSTPGDFGTQGEPPSHPELLDWLASELRERGWSRKALVRLVVGSATYRQSSAARPELDAVDARNRLLARQNRFRLPAENVRDQVLAASGLLDRAIGGPSIGPETPRRGLYLRIKRSQLDPMLVGFDAPAATQACPRRERSNTPLQSLILLNDKLSVEAARTLARRVLAEAGSGDAARLAHAFRTAVGRPPDSTERPALRRLLEGARAAYRADPAAARAFAGEQAGAERPIAEAAAFTAIARAVLNLDELVTRE